MILIFRPFLMRFSLSGILFSVLRRLEQQMGLKLFAQFLHKLSKQMSFQEYPVCDGHRQGPRLLSEFGIDCTVSQLNPAWLRGKMLAAFGNPSVTIAKHPADSFLHGVSSHRETANSEAKPWCCGGIPTLQIFPLAYRFQWLFASGLCRTVPGAKWFKTTATLPGQAQIDGFCFNPSLDRKTGSDIRTPAAWSCYTALLWPFILEHKEEVCVRSFQHRKWQAQAYTVGCFLCHHYSVLTFFLAFISPVF